MKVANPARTSVRASVPRCRSAKYESRKEPDSGTALLPVLAEVHGPLLHERVAPLHGFLGLVVEVQRGGGELGDTGALLGVDVERLLGERERGGALLQQLAA